VAESADQLPASAATLAFRQLDDETRSGYRRMVQAGVKASYRATEQVDDGDAYEPTRRSRPLVLSMSSSTKSSVLCVRSHKKTLRPCQLRNRRLRCSMAPRFLSQLLK